MFILFIKWKYAALELSHFHCCMSCAVRSYVDCISNLELERNTVLHEFKLGLTDVFSKSVYTECKIRKHVPYFSLHNLKYYTLLWVKMLSHQSVPTYKNSLMNLTLVFVYKWLAILEIFPFYPPCHLDSFAAFVSFWIVSYIGFLSLLCGILFSYEPQLRCVSVVSALRNYFLPPE